MPGLRNSIIFQLFFTLIFMLFLTVSAQAQYSGGTGEPDDPYKIANVQDLILLGDLTQNYDKHFIQDANIDLSGYIFNGAFIAWDTDSNKDGFQGTPFSGKFDGNGYIINNLHVQGSKYLGMFGKVDSDAILSNIALDNIDVNCTGDYAGGLVGYNDGSITLCYSTGTVSGNNFVGGLVGLNNSSITSSYCTGAVSGNYDTGGLVGYNNCSIILSYNTGTVTGNNSAGGLVGFNNGNITSSYSTGIVNGSDSVGGLVGFNYNSITSSYSTGTVSGINFVGGLVGKNIYGSITSSFWDTQTTEQNTSDGGIGKTTAQMQDVNNYLNAGWDFVDEQSNGTCNFWYVQEDEYPQLVIFSDLVPCEPQGSGTIDEPYLIYDTNDLGTVWYHPEAYYQLAEDIDLSDIKWNTSVVPFFGGRFDGNSHRIKSLNLEGAGYLGLFGLLGYKAEISNLALESVDVNGIGNYVGGLAGFNMGTIKQSYSTGIVSGKASVGGLIGNNYYSEITSSYSTSTVSGAQAIGGLAGINFGNITSSYSTGTISGIDNISGLVGCNYYGSIMSSFWDTQTSGQSTSDGGIGKTTLEMHDINTFLDEGWDFIGETDNGTEDIWTICEGTNYPRFVWQIPEGDFVCPDGIEIEDVNFFMDHWDNTNCDSSNNYCDGTDLDFSGTVDISDFKILLNNWLNNN